MIGRGRRPRTGVCVSVTTAGALAAMWPFLLGQGCPFFGGNEIIPVTPTVAISGASTGASQAIANFAPTFVFTSFLSDVRGEVGDVFTITWTDDDPDNNASITLLLDRDGILGNADDIILAVLPEDPDGTADTYKLDTGAVGLLPGRVRCIAGRVGPRPERSRTAARSRNTRGRAIR